MEVNKPNSIFNSWDITTKKFTTQDCVEPITEFGENFTILRQSLPIIEAFAEAYHNSFWKVNDVDFTYDSKIISTMRGTPIYDQLKYILSFFTIVEGPIAENLATFNCVDSQHLSGLFLRQQLQEIEHGKTYTAMLESGFSMPLHEIQQEIRKQVYTPALRAKMEFMKKSMDESQPLLLRLANAAFAEGIFFQSCFASIMYLKTTNNYPFSALYNANTYVIRDERLHRDMFIWLFKELRKAAKVDLSIYDKHVEDNYKMFLSLELEFINDLLQGRDDFQGLTREQLERYVVYTAKQTYAGLYDLEFNEQSPLDFMGVETLAPVINMFEKRGINYIAKPPPTDWSWIQSKIMDDKMEQ